MLRLNLDEISIPDYTLLTDADGAAFQKQIVSYMKNNIAYEAAKKLYSDYSAMYNIEKESEYEEESVDDGNLVMIGGKQYEANPFGLYCMHGNVCEWTRSDYVSYPYKENTKEVSEYKVARGGSFFERPKFSTSYSRKGFYPYQRVFNVGFRLIIED